MADRSRRWRRTFGPVVGAGLAGAALSAVAGHERWADGEGCGTGAAARLAAGDDIGQVPAAGALALVLLAAWGVLLVTRGRVRRAVAAVAALAALGLAAVVVTGPRSARDGVTDHLRGFGVDCVDVGLTGWYWLAAVGAVLAVVPAVLAVRLTPSWPEMGRRYDAPSDTGAAVPADPAAGRDPENLDLWKAIDEGRDPTA